MLSLENDKKVLLLKIVIEGLNSNKEKLIANSEESELLNQKVAIYNIAEEVIQEKIGSFSE